MGIPLSHYRCLVAQKLLNLVKVFPCLNHSCGKSMPKVMKPKFLISAFFSAIRKALPTLHTSIELWVLV